MRNYFKIVTLFCSAIVINTVTYAADIDTQDYKAKQNINAKMEDFVLSSSFTFAQLNSDAQAGVKSQFGRANIEQALGAKFKSQEEYEKKINQFLYFFEKGKGGYRVSFLGFDEEGYPVEGLALDSKAPKWHVNPDAFGDNSQSIKTVADNNIQYESTPSARKAINDSIYAANMSLLD
jgi:hypothetical protein